MILEKLVRIGINMQTDLFKDALPPLIVIIVTGALWLING